MPETLDSYTFPTRDFAGPVLVWHTPAKYPNTRMPIVSLTCDRCGEVAPLNGENVGTTRINGDSRYGYTTYHYGSCPSTLPDLGSQWVYGSLANTVTAVLPTEDEFGYPTHKVVLSHPLTPDLHMPLEDFLSWVKEGRLVPFEAPPVVTTPDAVGAYCAGCDTYGCLFGCR